MEVASPDRAGGQESSMNYEDPYGPLVATLTIMVGSVLLLSSVALLCAIVLSF